MVPVMPLLTLTMTLAVQLSMKVNCKFIKDQLNGDETTEMRVELQEILADATSKEYHEE